MYLTYTSGQEVLDAEKAKQPTPREETYLTYPSAQKILDAEIAKQFSSAYKKMRKVDDTEIIPSKINTSRTGRMIKLSAKARDAITKQSPEVEDLIVKLTHLLQNWKDKTITPAWESENMQSDDFLVIMATRVYAANAADQDQFFCSTQLDIKKPETYARVMQDPNTAEWARAIEEECDKLERNNTWELVHKSEVKPDHRPLGRM